MESKPTFLQNVMRIKPIAVIYAEENSNDLKRSMSLFDLICIGIGATVGSGVFATTGDIISATAGPAAVVSWIIGGLVCCINAVAYMELSTRVPASGSTYAYAYHAIGELPAVIGAWLVSLEYGVSGAGVARSWASKIEDWLLTGNPNGNYHWINLEYANFLGAVITILSVAVLLKGVRFGKLFVNTFTTLKVAVVFFIIIAGFAVMDTNYLSPFVPPRQELDGAATFGYQGIITGASQAFFGYVGFDEVCCLAAEAKNPKKTMPRAVIGTVLIAMFLSCFASFVLSGMSPYLTATSFGDGFDHQNLHWASEVVRAGEAITMPVVVLVSILAQPRLNYALACDGLMPRIFAKVDEKGNLFYNTLITGVVFTIMALVVPFSALWDIVSFGIMLSFNMSNVALLMVRTRKHSPTLAPKLIGSLVVSAFLAAYLYQQGYMNNGSEPCLVFAIIFLVATLASCAALYVKCQQEPNDPDNYSAPLVPFIPTLSILCNWYLSAQISHLGMALTVAWVGAACISYFVYGYNNSAGRTGWSELLHSLPNKLSTMRSPMISGQEDNRVPALSIVRDSLQ